MEREEPPTTFRATMSGAALAMQLFHFATSDSDSVRIDDNHCNVRGEAWGNVIV